MSTLDLTLETLEPIETPISNFIVGVLAGGAFAGGVIYGAVLVLT